MAPIIDLELVNPEISALSSERIRQYLPQRHEFELVDAVCFLDREAGKIVAYKDFQADDWWTRAHFPERPLLPGVLMAEGAAQVATILWKELAAMPGITVGFGGLEKVRFRGLVTPPARMYFMARAERMGSRMAQFPAQAFVDGKLVFEGTILGVRI